MNPEDPPPEPPSRPPSPGGMEGLDPAELLARALNTVQPSAGQKEWIPPAPEELARLLPQYCIESLLGHGGMGAVYKGRQPALDRPVAIKLLPAEIGADEQFIARFRREARTLAKLQHSGIVAVHDFGQTSQGHLYFVMEFVEGTDLQKILHGPGLNPAQTLELISQVCDALHYAHSKGVIHRDIKPGNILVTTEGRVKLADFGLARPVKEETSVLTGTRVMMGTADYMAPEQRDGHADQRADIYALGVMLYEMLTGKRPHGVFDPPSHRVQLDIRLDQVVLKALQHEPERRYQQVSEMKTDVDEIRTTPLPAGSKQKEPAKLPGRHGMFFAAVIIVVCVISAGILFSKKGGSTRLETDPAVTELRAATKEHPFVNSLGMKFVPVPGTQVLFCTTETTKGQYRQYAVTDAGASKVFEHVEREGVPVSPEDNHPVVMVTWGDPNAFCAWLSKKEGRTYRLPTDHEWSCAVGIGSREDPNATPVSKMYSVADVFPWGGSYPPEGGPVGNYLDRASLGKFRDHKSLANYEDGFTTTAPVGSFPSNSLGLHDLGGNVSEWCMDWNNPALKNERVTRGGNWNVGDEYNLSSSARFGVEPSSHWDGVGFRVVLLPDLEKPWSVTTGTVKFEFDLPVDAKAMVTIGANQYSVDDLKQPIALPAGQQILVFTQTGLSLPPQEFQVEKGIRQSVRVFDPDRRAAEWVLATGGWVRIAGNDRQIESPKELPPTSFKLSHIQLRRGTPGRIRDNDLAILEPLSELLFLDIQHQEISDGALIHLGKMAKLQEFGLFDCPKITGAGFAPLGNLKQLRALGFHGTQVGDIGLEHLKSMKSIQSLNLIGCPITDAGVKCLVNFANLSYLDLGGAKEITDEGLKVIGQLQNLDYLVVSHSKITDAGLAHLAALNKLQHLDVYSCAISDVGISSLTRLGKLSSLNLGRTRITDAALAPISQMKEMNKLDLTDTGITDKGIVQLGRSKRWQALDLDGTGCSDATLMALREFTELRRLDMNGNPISDNGLVHLSKLKLLDWVSLNGTSVSDAGLSNLKGLGRLRTLELQETRVTKAGVAQLKAALPDCNIVK